MTVNLQLQISGGNIDTYNIYQNSDLYVTGVATNVTPAELQGGYQLTLDDASTFIRLVANGTCGTYKDISINFSDPTPSIVYNGITGFSSSNFGTEKSSIVTDGINKVLGTSGGFWNTSDDNGSTWVTHGSNEAGYPICDKNGDFFMLRNTTMYKVINWGGTTSREVFTYNNPFEAGEVTVNYYYFNGLYYIRTNISLYRSSNNIDFTKVLSFPSSILSSQFGFVGYGNYIYLTTGTNLYKSIDDGLNWALMQSSGSFTNLYVENENNVLVLDTSSSVWKFSTNGGQTFSNSWLPTINIGNKSNVVVKSAGLYYYQSGSNCGSISHTTTSPFSATDEFNANYNISGTSILTTAGFPVNPSGLSISVSNNKLFFIGYINNSCVANGVNLTHFTITPT